MSDGASQDLVVGFLDSLREFWVCVDGGWGVDALLGQQTRQHADLDIIIRRRDAQSFHDAVRVLGFRRDADGGGDVFKTNTGLVVDVHDVAFDDRGFGCFDLPEGGVWPFPPQAFDGHGVIGELEVRCLSADAQVQCHAQGYKPDANDIADMQALQDHFGLVLPLAFYRR